MDAVTEAAFYVLVGGAALGVGLLSSALIGTLHVRQTELEQLRRWAREDGLSLTERSALVRHYRARGLWS